MASAYTPGLTVSGDIVVKKIRRLPIKGEVLVKQGDHVAPDTVLARAMLPGPLQTLKLAEKLGVEARDVPSIFKLKAGDTVEKGQVVAETKGLFGMFKSSVTADYSGVIESISEVTGNALVREPSIPVDVNGYIHGTVAQVIPEEGAIIETRCAMVQGIFGVGGERHGTIEIVAKDPSETLDAQHIKPDHRGKILVGGSGVTYEALQRATELGVVGLIVGGVKDSDLIKFLGFDIGVAITGQENISLTLLVTEGFGFLNMAQRTFELLKSLAGKDASLNGATQIRAGVIRPELIVPIAEEVAQAHVKKEAFLLEIGVPIRVIREPYFGRLGKVTGLPHQLVALESGTEVRVLNAKLDNGEDVTVPRANVEIMASE
ncbi:MAG: hypothetical protein ACAH95_09735 [Fimbriimonas sp.]